VIAHSDSDTDELFHFQ